MELSKDTLEELSSLSHFEISFDEYTPAYSFTTDNGQYYEITFIPYNISYHGNNYQTYMINLERPYDKNEFPKTYGNKLRNTVAIIMCEFILNHNNAIFNICSQEDNNEAVRDRLFNMWYNNIISTFNITNLYKYDIRYKVPECDYALYASMYHTNKTPSVDILKEAIYTNVIGD